MQNFHSTHEYVFFSSFLQENGGCLPRDLPAHALMYYALQIVRLNETQGRKIVLEGDPDPSRNDKQLFRSVARMYGVDPHQMEMYWPTIYRQLAQLGLTVHHTVSKDE